MKTTMTMTMMIMNMLHQSVRVRMLMPDNLFRAAAAPKSAPMAMTMWNILAIG